MKRHLALGAALLTAACGLSVLPPAHAGSLGKIGGALSYPFKKAARNGVHNAGQAGGAVAYPIKKGAGNGSKDLNTGGQAVQYPVRKTGVNASKTAHKVTQ